MPGKTQKQLFILGLLLCLLTPACRNFSMNTPARFVRYSKGSFFNIKAITAEGVRLKVRKKRAGIKAERKLWRESVLLDFKNRGYNVLEKKKIKTEKGQKGELFLTLYRFNQADYVYMVVFFPRGKNIYLVEAAGPYQEFMKHKESLVKSIKSFQLIIPFPEGL